MGPLSRPEPPPARTGSFRPILGAAVFLFVGVLAMAGVKSYRDLEAARQRRHLLEMQIQGTEAEIARLRGKIERLRSDPATLERLAREDLGMVRPGDVVIELPQDTSPAPAKPKPAVAAAVSTAAAPVAPPPTPAPAAPTLSPAPVPAASPGPP
jgi:cell division protein FtsB